MVARNDTSTVSNISIFFLTESLNKFKKKKKTVLSVVSKNSRNCTKSAWHQCWVTPQASCEESWFLSVSQIQYQMLGKKVCNLWDLLCCKMYPHGHLTAVLWSQHNKIICLPALSSYTPLSPHVPSQPHQCRPANPNRDHGFTQSTRTLCMGDGSLCSSVLLSDFPENKWLAPWSS